MFLISPQEKLVEVEFWNKGDDCVPNFFFFLNKCHNINHTEFGQIFHKSEISNTLLKISLAESSVT